jgi:preprotein translocase subunit SecD
MALRWRLGISLLVLGLCLTFAMPNVPGISAFPGAALLPQGKIALGLDLKGGIQLTLGVETDKAVANALAIAGQDLRRASQEEKIVVLRPRVVSGDNLEFTLPRAEDEPKFKKIIAEHVTPLAVNDPQRGDSGQLRYVARFTPAEKTRLENMSLDQALRTIRNRIDQFGVAEPDIRKQANNRIQVQLPGISDPRRAVELLKQSAHLEFHLVREDVDPGKAALPAGVITLPVLEKQSVSGRENTDRRLAVEKDVMLTGEDVADARPNFDRLNQAYVMLNFNSRGARVFEQVTAENVGKRMAIVLDGKIYSDPVIRERIGGGRASISGSFTTAEAQDLAIVLRAGSLPAPVTILEERSVGPSLGQESIDSGIKAAWVGSLGVAAFMAVYYGLSGMIAVAMLCFTLIIIVAGLTVFGATLTLPGIAGIVLTVGMAVDANVLIFERIREEIRLGLTPFAAVKAGFERAAISITDSNLTTILAAVILYQFGTGPIRGFAVTLSLGIVASMFTAIFVSRAVFEEWARRRGAKGLNI